MLRFWRRYRSHVCKSNNIFDSKKKKKRRTEISQGVFLFYITGCEILEPTARNRVSYVLSRFWRSADLALTFACLSTPAFSLSLAVNQTKAWSIVCTHEMCATPEMCVGKWSSWRALCKYNTYVGRRIIYTFFILLIFFII